MQRFPEDLLPDHSKPKSASPISRPRRPLRAILSALLLIVAGLLFVLQKTHWLIHPAIKIAQEAESGANAPVIPPITLPSIAVPWPSELPLPSRQPKPSPTPKGPVKPAPLGTVVELTTPGGQQVRIAVRALTAGVKSDNPYESPPKNGPGFVVADVEVSLTGGNEGFYVANPLHFRLTGTDGAVYSSVVVLGIEPNLPLNQMRVGQTVSGKVPFDVPKAARGGLVVEYTDLKPYALAAWSAA